MKTPSKTIGSVGLPAGKMAMNGICLFLFPKWTSSSSPSGEESVLSTLKVAIPFFSTNCFVSARFKATASFALQVSHQSAVKSTRTVVCAEVSSLSNASENGCHGSSLSPSSAAVEATTAATFSVPREANSRSTA